MLGWRRTRGSFGARHTYYLVYYKHGAPLERKSISLTSIERGSLAVHFVKSLSAHRQKPAEEDETAGYSLFLKIEI